MEVTGGSHTAQTAVLSGAHFIQTPNPILFLLILLLSQQCSVAPDPLTTLPSV